MWCGASKGGRCESAGAERPARERSDRRDLECGIRVEVGQDAGQARREHRLAGARAARASSRWCPPAAAVTSASTAVVVARDIGEVAGDRRPAGVGPADRGHGVDGLRLELAAVPDRRVEERGHADHLHPGHERRLGARSPCGHHHRVVAGAHGGEHGGQDAVDRPQPAVEPELAEVHDPIDRLDRAPRRLPRGTRSRSRGRSPSRAWAAPRARGSP